MGLATEHGYRSDMSSLSDFLAEPRNVIVAGVMRDGRPHLSPNWFFWDGSRFFISTTSDRVKSKIFSRDPRAELIVDDATGHRYVRVSGTVEILDDVPGSLPIVRAIRQKHGMAVPSDEELTASLIADHRLLLAVTPAKPPTEWSIVGLEA
ncbi:MAG TPA: TIGR03618 family F420-dependent PPOX class oxidoreductase [Pseudonocardia sp.]